MGGIIWIIIVGFVAGIIARLLSPGPNNPSGFILTTVLGIVGAFLATFIGQAIGHYGPDQGAGFITATIGALVVLFIWNRLVASGVISGCRTSERRQPRHSPRSIARMRMSVRDEAHPDAVHGERISGTVLRDSARRMTARMRPHESNASPASMRTNSPVILPDAGGARKHTSCAMSSAVDATSSGTFAITESRTALRRPRRGPW